MDIVIIEYNAGNIRSVDFALQRMGVKATITNNHKTITKANKVIFPGVGEASSTMEHLKKEGLDKVITGLQQPVLGICLGLQLMSAHSEENNTEGLGLFPATVYKFRPGVKIPHVGWNQIYHLHSGLFKGIDEKSFVYFVHSYYAELTGAAIATSNYQQPFAASMHVNNFYATQFHPEKSGTVGAQILKNFLAL